MAALLCLSVGMGTSIMYGRGVTAGVAASCDAPTAPAITAVTAVGPDNGAHAPPSSFSPSCCGAGCMPATGAGSVAGGPLMTVGPASLVTACGCDSYVPSCDCIAHGPVTLSMCSPARVLFMSVVATNWGGVTPSMMAAAPAMPATITDVVAAEDPVVVCVALVIAEEDTEGAPALEPACIAGVGSASAGVIPSSASILATTCCIEGLPAGTGDMHSDASCA
mmetsp:Transcript_30411/g.77616  ORF Transcript_30411/g.77616 Transcript_30411/m.77616 type:complete len:222 (-) Transcript_30411:239-904(-)